MTDIFKTLNAIDVNSYLKTKFKFKFLPWMSAWTIVKNIYPNSYYEVQKFDNKPYLFDEQLGYMIFTKITINDNCLECWLPVMDYSNKAMKHVKYNYKDNRQIEKTVESATMFDINTSIMRCLVKNIAMHGLGSYVYVGDDLPFEFDNNLLKSANDIKIENKKKKLKIKEEIKLLYDKVKICLNENEIQKCEDAFRNDFNDFDDLKLMEILKWLKSKVN